MKTALLLRSNLGLAAGVLLLAGAISLGANAAQPLQITDPPTLLPDTGGGTTDVNAVLANNYAPRAGLLIFEISSTEGIGTGNITAYVVDTPAPSIAPREKSYKQGIVIAAIFDSGIRQDSSVPARA